jgi:ubiquitin-conjugating enzyme E2 J1
VRRRLAAESPNFKCPVCNRTNGEIVKECEERAKEAGQPSDDVQVPDELNMGFRDEMEAAAAKKEKEEASNGADTTAELAEGFVQTVPVPAAPAPETAVRARAVQPVNAPAPPMLQQQQQQQRVRRASDDGIPVWMDRVIVVLVVLLAALVLKVLFAV